MSETTAGRTTAIVIGCLAAALLWCFADVLLFGYVLAFRDTAHYYFPQLSLIADEIFHGRLPLWNPYLNTGVPLLATGNTGMFYPPLWLALVCPGKLAHVWSLYVVAHVALAAWAAYRMGRGFGCTQAASGVAALAYAFGGAVLFQYANVVYLIGAAWLPLAILAVERIRSRPTRRDIALLGVTLAMMVLGGDPQLAYHVGIVAALRILLPARASSEGSAVVRRSDAALGVMAGVVVALVLSAVQWLPSYVFAGSSDRAIEPVVAATDASEAAVSGALTPHSAKRYWFSVGPWRLAELFVPNFSGRMFPRHQRWLDALPAETQPWTPSLYLGIVPLVLAGVTWRCAGRDPRCAWLWAVAVLAVLASFGRYGLGWCGEELGLVTPAAAELPDQVRATGGLYWLMSETLPGYDVFRYPAKWTVVAAVAIAALAAIGWDRFFAEDGAGVRGDRLVRCLMAFAVTTLLVAGLLTVTRGYWTVWGAHVPADPLFGPFDAVGAGWGLVLSFAQAGCASLIAAIFIGRRQRLGQTAAVALLALTAVDLALASKPLVATVPLDAGVFDVAGVSERSRVNPRRTIEPGGLPAQWLTESSDDRLAEWLAWQRRTLRPNWNMVERTPVGIVSPAVWPYAAKAWFRGQIERGHSATVALNAAPLSRTWVCGNVAVLPTIDETSAEDVDQRTGEVLDRLDAAGGAEHLAVVESDAQTDARPDSTDGSPGKCEIVAETTDRVEVTAELSRAGVLVLADLYTPDWTATVETDDVRNSTEVLRVNRIMRGVALSAGVHRVTFEYRPVSFTIGALTSGIAWLVLVGVTLRSLRQS